MFYTGMLIGFSVGAVVLFLFYAYILKTITAQDNNGEFNKSLKDWRVSTENQLAQIDAINNLTSAIRGNK